MLVDDLCTLVKESQPAAREEHESATQDDRQDDRLWRQAFQLLPELEQRFQFT